VPPIASIGAEIDVPHHRRPDADAGHQQHRGPRVRREDVVGRARTATHRLAPVIADLRHFDLAHDDLEQPVHDVVLVLDVVVERHRLDAELA
jgi:hypothetical protein